MKMMKGILVLLALLSLFGCKPADQGQDTEGGNGGETAAVSAGDYFPIRQDVRYTYEGSGNEYASYVMTVDYTSGNKVQQRTDNGGTVAATVYAFADGKLVRQFSAGEIYYRENFLDKAGEDQEVLLMEPIEAGTSWTAGGGTRTITAADAGVDTPSGSYKAVEVTTVTANDTTVYYYAKDIGLVKSVFRSGEMEVTSTLGKIEENVPVTQTVSFFFPYIDDDKIHYLDADVEFRTNDVTKDVLEAAYKKNISDKFGLVLTSGTKINSLSLTEENIVAIDLSGEFLTEMNLGSGFEARALQSIANTFGKYYGSDKVLLTVGGKPYESGHIAMKEGEYITADWESAVKAD